MPDPRADPAESSAPPHLQEAGQQGPQPQSKPQPRMRFAQVAIEVAAVCLLAAFSAVALDHFNPNIAASMTPLALVALLWQFLTSLLISTQAARLGTLVVGSFTMGALIAIAFMAVMGGFTQIAGMSGALFVIAAGITTAGELLATRWR